MPSPSSSSFIELDYSGSSPTPSSSSASTSSRPIKINNKKNNQGSRLVSINLENHVQTRIFNFLFLYKQVDTQRVGEKQVSSLSLPSKFFFFLSSHVTFRDVISSDVWETFVVRHFFFFFFIIRVSNKKKILYWEMWESRAFFSFSLFQRPITISTATAQCWSV